MLPTFETERLLLKEVTRADIPAYKKHFVDFEVIRHLSGAVPWPYPDDGVEQFLENVIFPAMGKTRWMWGLFLKERPDELIGAVDLWWEGRPEHRGFWLSRAHWGKGLMTEAVVPITNYAFSELGYEKLVFSNGLGNDRSRRIKEKTGARLVEVRPTDVNDRDRYTQQEIWELTREAWGK